MSPGVVVRVEGLVRRYGPRHALAGVSFVAQQGVTVVLGPNGAGKSTLFKILSTADQPDAGIYTLNDRSALDRSGRQEARRHIGWLPQVFGYEPRATVAEYVGYLAWLRQVPRSRRGSAVSDALEVVGLADRAHDRLRSLSGGMVRRVGIAQAIVAGSPFLLLDEPTAGLDPVQRQDFYQLLRQVAVDRTILLATHLAEDVDEIAESVVILRSGQKVWDGTATALRKQAGSVPLAKTIAGLMTADDPQTRPPGSPGGADR